MASSSRKRHTLSGLATGTIMLGLSGAYAESDLIADLELVVEPPLPATLVPGAIGTLELTVTNHGPDDAGFKIENAQPAAFSSLLAQRPDAELDIYFFPPDPADDCVLVATVLEPRPPNTQVLWGFGLHFPPIAAGDSVTCALRYELHPDISNQAVPISWRVRPFAETDPNPDNDVVSQVFDVGGIAPPQPARPVPGLNLVGIGLLVLGVLGFGFTANGRRRRRSQGALVEPRPLN